MAVIYEVLTTRETFQICNFYDISLKKSNDIESCNDEIIKCLSVPGVIWSTQLITNYGTGDPSFYVFNIQFLPFSTRHRHD